MDINFINLAGADSKTLTALQDFSNNYLGAVTSGSIVNEVSRKIVTVTLMDMPEKDGACRPLQVNGMTSPSGKTIQIDIDQQDRPISELRATLLHEFTHAYNPNLIYAKGLKDAINLHSPEFYEKVQKDAETLGIPAHQSGTESGYYQQALIETGRPIVVVERSTSSWANEVSTSINQPQGQTKVVDTPSGPKTVPVTTTVNTPAGPKTVWVDSSYAQTAADNARNAVVAAKAAAAAARAAAWQQQNNRDRQDGGSSSTNSSPTSGGNSSGGGSSGGGGSTGGGGSSGSGTTSGGSGGYSSGYGAGNYSYGGTSGGGNSRTGGGGGADSGQASNPKPVVSQASRNGHPILIDLDGDGVEFSPLGGGAARFDFDNDGFKELTAWVGEDDGLLVYDLGADGKVTHSKEIAFADFLANKQVQLKIAA